MTDALNLVVEMWAYLIVDPTTGVEKLCSSRIDGVHYPYIAARLEHIENLRPIAEQMGRDSNATVRLVKFTRRIDVEIITNVK